MILANSGWGPSPTARPAASISRSNACRQSWSQRLLKPVLQCRTGVVPPRPLIMVSPTREPPIARPGNRIILRLQFSAPAVLMDEAVATTSLVQQRPRWYSNDLVGTATTSLVQQQRVRK